MISLENGLERIPLSFNFNLGLLYMDLISSHYTSVFLEEVLQLSLLRVNLTKSLVLSAPYLGRIKDTTNLIQVLFYFLFQRRLNMNNNKMKNIQSFILYPLCSVLELKIFLSLKIVIQIKIAIQILGSLMILLMGLYIIQFKEKIIWQESIHLKWQKLRSTLSCLIDK